MQPTIRQAKIKDVDAIRFLFRDTVIAINSADYTPEEIIAWSDCYKNTDSWTKNIQDQYFLVATIGHTIAGFGSITNNGYIDFLYVHKDFQRQGVAQKLLEEMENYADRLSLKTIFSHVSKTARPFFEKNNFIKTGEIVNKAGEIEFVNSVMVKTK